MATFVLIHGAADVGWYWQLVEAELRRRGHEVVAPDLPCDDDSAGYPEYVETVVDAIGGLSDVVVVAQSFGGFTAPLVADRLPVEALVLVTGMIPVPGEKAEEWFADIGYAEAVQEQARRDGGKTGSEDPFVVFYHDVPSALAEEALSKGADPVAHRWSEPVAARQLAGRADEVRPVHRGSLLPARPHAQGRPRAACNVARRDHRRALRRAQPAEGTAGGPARGLPGELTAPIA